MLTMSLNLCIPPWSIIFNLLNVFYDMLKAQLTMAYAFCMTLLWCFILSLMLIGLGVPSVIITMAVPGGAGATAPPNIWKIIIKLIFFLYFFIFFLLVLTILLLVHWSCPPKRFYWKIYWKCIIWPPLSVILVSATTHQSTIGFCTNLGGNCISWSAEKQPTLARSSSEAEYRGPSLNNR